MKKENAEQSARLIELRGVNKQFPTASGVVPVLTDVNLAVAPGEFIAIVGKSGSGKSTLLNMITGIDHPSQGSVTIRSTDVHGLDESSLAKWRGRNVGIVFQFFQLIPTLTIRENLLLAMDFVGSIPRRERSDRAEALLARVGIAAHADKLPADLSGGEQQRAAIARALANDPPVLVADEPTGNLDSKTTLAIQRLFSDLVKSGKTVIVVTHEDVSHSGYERIISLKDGVVVSDTRNN
jgi:putative ABC transport system ATP-binding protein